MDGQPKQSQPPAAWHYKSDKGAPITSGMPEPQRVAWTASEFVANEKSSGWYAMLALGAIILGAAIFFITRDWFSIVVIIIIAFAFGVLAARPPRVLHYILDSHGLQIEKKRYPYGSFRSFSVINEGAINSILLIPLRRFMPPLSLYYSPEDENKILDLISSYLPLENRQRDAIDRLMHKVRF